MGEVAALVERRDDLAKTQRRVAQQLATLRERLGDDAPDVDDPSVAAAAAARAKLVASMRRLRRLSVLADALEQQSGAVKVRVCGWCCGCSCSWGWGCGCGSGCDCRGWSCGCGCDCRGWSWGCDWG